MKQSTKRLFGLVLILVGIGFFLVPLTSMSYHALKNADAMAAYVKEMAQRSAEDRETEKAQAMTYNANVNPTGESVVDPFTVREYATAGPVGENVVFGYLIVPRIDEKLPIYIGASEHHLSLGVAQVDGTSMPVGGNNTRSVIAGHRGYARQAMFRNAEEIVEGDRIYVVTSTDILAYDVYGTEVIGPSEGDKLAVIEGQDTLTLLTCTPYMVNTYRLLINAKRAEFFVFDPGEKELPTAGVMAAALDEIQSDNLVSKTVTMRQYVLYGATVVFWLGFVYFGGKLLFGRKKERQ